MKVVLTLADGTRGEDYRSALLAAGFEEQEILPLPPRDAAPAELDGLLLSGGGDVDPRFYAQEPGDRLEGVSRRRDEQELALIATARRKGVPIFGICRGLQILNVAYGGSLVQDLPSRRPSSVRHEVSTPRDFRAHEVTILPGSFLAAGPGSSPRLAVNSRHHQGIDRLGSGLRASALSDDGLIEAVEAVASPGGGSARIFAVEWHPENLKDDADARGLFERFFAAVRERSRSSP